MFKKIFYKLSFTLILLFIYSHLSFSQKRKYEGMGAIKEIMMPAQARTVGHFSLFYEATFPNDSTGLQPFWYKIVFNKDCELKFNLFPIMESDRYDFKLLKIENDLNFCDAAEKNKIFHIDGIKVHRTWHDSEQTQSFRSNLVFTKTVPVKKGDAIYIEIIHLWGEGYGHIIDLVTCDYSYVLKAMKNDSAIATVDSAATAFRELTPEEERQNAVARIKNSLCPLKGLPAQLSAIAFNEKTVDIQDRFVSKGQVVNSTDELKKIIPQKENKITNVVTEKKNDSLNSVKLRCLLSDAYSGEFIKTSPVIVCTEDSKVVIPQQKENGINEFTLTKNKPYQLTYTSVDYFDYSLSFNTLALSDSAEKHSNLLEIKLEPINSTKSTLLNTIYFHPNSAAIKPESDFEMGKLKTFLKNNPNAVIELAGHTNGNHTIKPEKIISKKKSDWIFEGSSRELSTTRINKVKEQLIKFGVKEERIKTKSYGGDRPVYPSTKNWDEVKKNMRVEILLISNTDN